uniref:hypothetical protein n=1 Tax=Pseudomonas syringae TaxID=317 RepID=UPI001E2E6098|nr:hypothetical protein [Pseudomonas syringae]QOQ33344.1 hypothetical protein [Pseudomonas syringae pv. actinidiae]
MMPIDPLELLERLQTLYAAYSKYFYAAAMVVLVNIAYFAVLSLSARCSDAADDDQ